MKYEIEVVANIAAFVGEAPVWDWRLNILYWTDIRRGRMYQFDPATRENRKIHEGIFVGGLAVNRPGGLTLGTWEGVQLWRSDDDTAWLEHGHIGGHPLQFNDCTAGPDGSFYAGTYFDDGIGKLFRFRPSGHAEVVAEDLGISNGMGFSPDLSTFYHTESISRTIYRYDYDATNHVISNRHTLVKLGDDEGIPDGMTIDADGFIWSANYGGGAVIRFDPDGKEERRIRFGATQTSSVMFGGEDLSDLYVTSIARGDGLPPSGLEPKIYDFSAHRGGELFRVKLDVQGKREFETEFLWPQ